MFGIQPIVPLRRFSPFSSHARRPITPVKREQNPPFVFQSESGLSKELSKFLIEEAGTDDRWHEFRQFFTYAPLPFAKKMSILQKIINSGSYNWWRGRQLINELPEECESYDDLIKLVVPLYFATHECPQNISKNAYQQQKYFFVLSIGYRFTNGKAGLTFANLSELLTAKSGSGDSSIKLAELFVGAAQHYEHFAITLFSLLNQCLDFDKFNQTKLVHKMITDYLTHVHTNSEKLHINFISILRKLLNKKIKGIDATIILNLLSKIPISSMNFKPYSALLIELLHNNIDKSVVKKWIQSALVKPTIPDGHKNFKPMYTLITMSDFGDIFFSLAKEDLLPALKYSKAMREALYKHIESLPDKERDAVILSIKQHDSTPICDFFWKKPKTILFFSTKPHLSKQFKERIDLTLPRDPTSQEYYDEEKVSDSPSIKKS